MSINPVLLGELVIAAVAAMIAFSTSVIAAGTSEPWAKRKALQRLLAVFIGCGILCIIFLYGYYPIAGQPPQPGFRPIAWYVFLVVMYVIIRLNLRSWRKIG